MDCLQHSVKDLLRVAFTLFVAVGFAFVMLCFVTDGAFLKGLSGVADQRAGLPVTNFGIQHESKNDTHIITYTLHTSLCRDHISYRPVINQKCVSNV